MAISGIAGVAAPFVPPSVSGPAAASPAGAGKAAGTEKSAFARGLEAAEKLQDEANTAATGVATGSLQDVHHFTTAAAKASLSIELTAALRDRAVGAYQEIMRMQV